MAKRLIVPILNTSVDIVMEPPLFLNDNIVIQQASQDEFQILFNTFHDKDPSFYTLLKPSNVLIIISDIDKSSIDNEVLKIVFLLNIFRDKRKNPLATWKAIFENGVEKDIVVLKHQPIHEKNNFPKYGLLKSYSKAVLNKYYQLLTNACKRKESIYFTIEKYNSTINAKNDNDKVVDLTICLESLLPGNTELTYRFSLIHTLLSNQKEKERLECFNCLKELYRVRSNIVHGDINKKTKKKIQAILSESSLFYEVFFKSFYEYILFHGSPEIPKDGWDIFLHKLALNQNN